MNEEGIKVSARPVLVLTCLHHFRFMIHLNFILKIMFKLYIKKIYLRYLKFYLKILTFRIFLYFAEKMSRNIWSGNIFK